MEKSIPLNIESFTIKMDNKSYDESEFASIVSQTLKNKKSYSSAYKKKIY